MFFVNGKYRTGPHRAGGDREVMFIIEQLVAKERAGEALRRNFAECRQAVASIAATAAALHGGALDRAKRAVHTAVTRMRS
jgi:hypothetical protein